VNDRQQGFGARRAAAFKDKHLPETLGGRRMQDRRQKSPSYDVHARKLFEERVGLERGLPANNICARRSLGRSWLTAA
jgi:hypothetical protein